MDDDDFIGTKIRRLREARGLTALALHRLTGLSQATIHRAERGGIVSQRTAAKLAPVLKCKPRDLVAGEHSR